MKLRDELLPLNILVILLIVIITLFPSSALRVIVGLPFILFFSGYTLIAALFPRKSDLDSIERAALSFGLSLVVVPLIGLILNYTPWGIRLYPMFISVATFIVILSTITWYRRHKLPNGERFTISFNLSFRPWKGKSTLDKVLSVVLVAAILGAIGIVGYVIATPKVGEEFTEFYIVGPEGKATDYPRQLVVGEKGRVVVGIVSHERETTSYRVGVRIDGVTQSETGPIVLEPEEKWEEEVSFVSQMVGGGQKVEFLIYKDGGTEPYLETLHLWVDVRE